MSSPYPLFTMLRFELPTAVRRAPGPTTGTSTAPQASARPAGGRITTKIRWPAFLRPAPREQELSSVGPG
eukprot:483803-Rhodomonas_salina.1